MGMPPSSSLIRASEIAAFKNYPFPPQDCAMLDQRARENFSADL